MPTARADWLGSVLVIAAASLFGLLGVTSRFAYDAGLQPLQIVGGATILLAALIVQSGSRPTESGAVLPAPGGP